MHGYKFYDKQKRKQRMKPCLFNQGSQVSKCTHLHNKQKNISRLHNYMKNRNELNRERCANAATTD